MCVIDEMESRGDYTETQYGTAYYTIDKNTGAYVNYKDSSYNDSGDWEYTHDVYYCSGCSSEFDEFDCGNDREKVTLEELQENALESTCCVKCHVYEWTPEQRVGEAKTVDEIIEEDKPENGGMGLLDDDIDKLTPEALGAIQDLMKG